MNLIPLDDRVLIEPIDEEEKVGTLLIPDTAKEKPSRGLVMAVGNEFFPARIPIKDLLKEGDRVIFNAYAGQEVKVGNRKYRIVTRFDILAVLR